MLMHVAETVD
jgi:hypothetical protein